MRVEKTSPTSFELQSNNGCVAIAGFATWTMGAAGVYWHRVTLITKEDADTAFRADPRVKEALANLK
jgi:hypothetical protein